MTEQQFADMTWQPRWNEAEVVGSYDYYAQRGTIFCVGPMGVIALRLEDVGAYTLQMRRYLDGLETYAAFYVSDAP